MFDSTVIIYNLTKTTKYIEWFDEYVHMEEGLFWRIHGCLGREKHEYLWHYRAGNPKRAPQLDLQSGSERPGINGWI